MYATPTPNASAKWAAVPTVDNQTIVQSTSSANESGVNLDVYYGVRLNNSQAAGTYTGEITYTALGKISPSLVGTASVTPTIAGYNSSAHLTITTSLVTPSLSPLRLIVAPILYNSSLPPCAPIPKNSLFQIKPTPLPIHATPELILITLESLKMGIVGWCPICVFRVAPLSPIKIPISLPPPILSPLPLRLVLTITLVNSCTMATLPRGDTIHGSPPQQILVLASLLVVLRPQVLSVQKVGVFRPGMLLRVSLQYYIKPIITIGLILIIS